MFDTEMEHLKVGPCYNSVLRLRQTVMNS